MNFATGAVSTNVFLQSLRPEASTIVSNSYLHMCLTTKGTIKILFSSLNNKHLSVSRHTFNHHDYSNAHVSHSVPMTVPASDDVIS